MKYVQGTSNWTKSFSYSCISFQGILRIKLISCSENSLARKLLNSFDGCSTFFSNNPICFVTIPCEASVAPTQYQNHHGASHYAGFFSCLLMSVIVWVTTLSYIQGGNIWRCVTQTFYDFIIIIIIIIMFMKFQAYFLFLVPQDEVGPSISSSVVLCSFVSFVYIVVLVLVVYLCPSSVRVLATFPGIVLFPLCSVVPFFP